ncbi:YtfJ family protein [uncultured Cedecea sp.]|uniref:YtfJ family protein n=1 Tax=uncultured Cedecea sp. TaxID=988762 RepID=UPI00261D7515|nr:YtfJ family protein [uncultured Cedecea sp.]
MNRHNAVLILALLTPFIASAHLFQEQHRLPPVGIADKGELILDNNQLSYKNWNTARLPGKVRVLQHIAGRSSAKEQNAPLIEAIKAANLPHDQYQTTTIINVDDAIIGSGIFVRNSIEDSKKQFPWSQFIVDDQGVAAKAWQLTPEGSAIVVLDKDGRIEFAKDGALNPQEIQQVISLLQSLLNKP